MFRKALCLALLAIAVYAVWGQGELAVNEIMYNSIGYDQEWIEFKNCVYGDVYLDSTWILTDGEGDFHFPEITVHGGEYLTVIVDTVWDSTTVIHFEPNVDATGHNVKLANTGDDVILLHIVDDDTIVVDSVTYDPSWGPESDGDGPSLERIDAWGESNDPANWQASPVDWGTPGADNPVREKSVVPRTIKVTVGPNPFNATCAIRIHSSTPGSARILDISGRAMASWALEAGANDIMWRAKNAPSGAYILIADNSEESASLPIVLVR